MKHMTTIVKAVATAAALILLFGGCVFIIGDLPNPADYTADLTIELSWDEFEESNADLWITFPNPDDGDTTNDSGEPEFENPYDDLTEKGFEGGDPGFYLGDAAEFRERVHEGNRESTFTASSTPSVELVESQDDAGRELAVIRRAPFDSTGLSGAGIAYRTAPSTALGLTGYPRFAWIGVTEVYVDGDSSADTEVTIYNRNDDPIITLALPSDISIQSMSVARIHHFLADDGAFGTDYYVVVPDQRTIPGGTSGFRSVGGDVVVVGDGAFGVVGSPRTE